ncbi:MULTISPECIES: Nif11-like leader peptide family natural product precursor [Prosthecochloris]|uniref:Nif11-like leader peptide family natural product n=1 Tax=Prosthecochloris marina TaxID=2017681 RepID=A0A317T5B0_9CHLB|nr:MULTISPECIES: Nif11-like leader peptide family natural product precursor [Prosthecochloris]PWW81902.1 Nif11-like leader peptide family natural product precursor [Prosthecochloris marina]UZJ38598.1 Nif11-like leader peptide family natural product precursor [Prosthecochloris sp. SCSIO W1103]
MSVQSAKEFLEKITSDDAFRHSLISELAKVRSELVSQAGFEFNEKELEEAKSSLPAGVLGQIPGWFCDMEESGRPYKGRKCGGGLWH